MWRNYDYKVEYVVFFSYLYFYVIFYDYCEVGFFSISVIIIVNNCGF